MSSGRVFIWYPQGGKIGHASMEVGTTQYEVTVTDMEYARVIDTEIRTQNYVSWWPDESIGMGGVIPGAKVLGSTCTFKEDIKSENRPPDISYQLSHLDVPAMIQCWNSIRQKQGGHYRLLRKNCSTIVARVLRAGGAERLLASGRLNIPFSLAAHSMAWTPHKVAKLCDELCEKNHGKKVVRRKVTIGVRLHHVVVGVTPTSDIQATNARRHRANAMVGGIQNVF